MNEVQRRNRQLAAGMHRSDQQLGANGATAAGNRLDGSNLSATNNYAAYGNSMVGGGNSTVMQMTRDEFGNTVPLPLHGQQTTMGGA